MTCLQSAIAPLGIQHLLEADAQDALLLSDAVGYAHASNALAEKLDWWKRQGLSLPKLLNAI